MEKNDDLILTGWGHAEYVAAAAVALKALGGRADVKGVSRRRLPEFLAQLAAEEGEPRWKRLFLLGLSLGGDPETLAAALAGLKSRGVSATWISAFEMPEAVAAALDGLLEVRCHPGKGLLKAVGLSFKADVKPFIPFAADAVAPGRNDRVAADVRDYLALIEAAQFHYRNYQDETLYARAARCLANGVRPQAWEPGLRRAVEHYGRYGGRELIGNSREIATLRDRINRAAAHEHARVLILGESGTGKETVAQQIHTKSPRRDMPFVAFNCASVNGDLLEDRFFGHERGAFTNAVERTDGLFALADGGTLFLDEIGDMPSEVQALLLRVLEGGRFMRVGGREELTCDVRLITATNRDLPAMVRAGRFREDLFQRLNVVQLRTPSLREHMGDVPAIANHWWRKYHGNHVLGEAQLSALMDYDYPGNVRELINILDRATALEEDDFELVMREHKEMNAGLSGVAAAPKADAVQGAVQGGAPGGAPERLEDAIRLHVRRVYEKYGKNLTRAAEALDISRNTVRKYL